MIRFNDRLTTSRELISLDAFGKVIVWSIRELKHDESERILDETGT